MLLLSSMYQRQIACTSRFISMIIFLAAHSVEIMRGDYHCTEDEVRGMLRDQAVKGMDNKILLGMELDIFYPETIKSFRTRHKAVNPDHVWHKLEDNAYLERIGAAAISDVDGKLHLTVAGLLMFGEEYKIRYEFTNIRRDKGKTDK